MGVLLKGWFKMYNSCVQRVCDKGYTMECIITYILVLVPRKIAANAHTYTEPNDGQLFFIVGLF